MERLIEPLYLHLKSLKLNGKLLVFKRFGFRLQACIKYHNALDST